jgi:hypothetical protein
MMLHLIPLFITALGWYAFERINRGRGWFRRGEVIFWDAVLLVIVFLVWLRWF